MHKQMDLDRLTYFTDRQFQIIYYAKQTKSYVYMTDWLHSFHLVWRYVVTSSLWCMFDKLTRWRQSQHLKILQYIILVHKHKINTKQTKFSQSDKMP